VSNDVKVPAFRMQSDDEDWRTFLYNQERIISQGDALLEMQKRLVDAMEKVASPERTRKVEEGQAHMVEAINQLSEKMEVANEQLGLAVSKLASAFWGLMKVPVAVIVVGVASWAFLYEHQIGENTWLIMLAVAVFPWLGDSITAIVKLVGSIRGRNGTADK
jgi:hypothetical protein